jgi:acyl carrier protein
MACSAGRRRVVRVTFSSLAQTSDPEPMTSESVPGASGTPDPFEHETIELLKRISRRPIDPTPDSELLADLGFDSLQVLELVGELEDHFKIAVPLNDLTHIRTVAQVITEVRTLVAAAKAGSQ